VDSSTDVIPQERAKRSGGTLRSPDMGCTDARSTGTAASTGIPTHAINSVGRRTVPFDFAPRLRSEFDFSKLPKLDAANKTVTTTKS